MYNTKGNGIGELLSKGIHLDEILIYLRKSRSDDPLKTVEEVLAKHESDLQEYAVREYGQQIPESQIFREIVSGETIDERPNMLEVLSRIENPKIKGVLVVEPQRLSRGDLEDCGRIVNAFRYSKTYVITPSMTYNLENKMERKFFEQELMRGNDYLEYTKEILFRGRILAVKKGQFLSNIAPYGFDKVVVDGMHTLKENDDADAVRLVFNMFVNQGKTYLEIARHLDSIGVKPMKGVRWDKCTIKRMIRNPHYCGKIRFNEKKTVKTYEDGELVTRRNIPSDPDEIIIVEGLHKGIVSEDLFNQAQEIADGKSYGARNTWMKPLQNPLASIIRCKKCDKAMYYHPYKKAESRIECRQRRYCGSKSVKLQEVVDSVAFALEHEKLPELEVKIENNDGDSIAIQKKQLEKMNAELVELQEQEERQYTFLEKGIYSEAIFVKRNTELHAEMEALKTKIYEVKKNVPKEIDYGKKMIQLKEAIAGLKNPDLSPKAKNDLLKAVVERIDFEFLTYEGKGKYTYRLDITMRF